MQLEKAAKTTFVRKICTFNVDEIDTWTIPSDDVKAFILSVISDNI